MRTKCRVTLAVVSTIAAVCAAEMTGLVCTTETRTTSQIFGDALNGADNTNDGFWTITRSEGSVGTSSASLLGARVAARSRFASSGTTISTIPLGNVINFR